MTDQDLANRGATGALDEPWRDWLEALTHPVGPVVSVKRRRRLARPDAVEEASDDAVAGEERRVDRATRVFRLNGASNEGVDAAVGRSNGTPDDTDAERPSMVRPADADRRRSTRMRRRPSHRPGAVTRIVFPPAGPRPDDATAAGAAALPSSSTAVGHGAHAVTMRALDALRTTLAEIRALAGFRLD